MKNRLWNVGCWMLDVILPMGLVRYVEGDGGGGGGEPWFGSSEGLDEGVVGTLGGFESREAAFAALHESSQPGIERFLKDSPDLLGDEFIKGLTDKPVSEIVSTLAKETRDLRALKGKKGLMVPGEAATPEQQAAFRSEINKVLGVPEKPDGYAFEMTEAAKNAGVTDEVLNSFREFAHSKNFTPEQFADGMNFYAEMENTAQATFEAAEKERAGKVDARLTELWGAEKEANEALIVDALKKAGLSGDTDPVDAIVNYQSLLLNMAQSMQEGSPPFSVASAGNLEQQLAALKADPAYTNPRLRVGPKAKIMEQVMSLQGQIVAAKKK